jgi:hypothetical protein
MMGCLNASWMVRSWGVHLRWDNREGMRARLTYVFIALVALAFPALAQDRRGATSLDRVLPEIRRNVPGTFYDADGPYLTPDGRATYRVKWMTPDGRIIWFTVDARSGQIMGGVPVQPRASRFRDDSGWGDRRNNWRDNDDGNRGNGWGNGNDRGNGRGNGHGNGGGNWGNDRGRTGKDHDRRHDG